MTHFPVILLELGGIQIYHFQTKEEFNSNKPYTDVYWRELGGKEAYGPFQSLFQACQHSNWVKKQQKIDKESAKLIKVDFRSKKRI